VKRKEAGIDRSR